MARPGFSIDKKFRRLAHDLDDFQAGFGRVLARGSLELLWDTAYEACTDELGDAFDVEAAAEWRGPPGRLVKALLEAGGPGKAGFVEEGGSAWWPEGAAGTYRVHDLWDHAPEYAKKRVVREEEREAKGKSLKEMRAEAGRKGAATTNAKRTAHGQPPSDKRPANGATGDDKASATVSTPAGTPAPAPAPAPTPAPGAAAAAREVPLDDPPPRRLEVENEAGAWPETPSLWPLVEQFRPKVAAACGRTTPHPVGGGVEVWQSLERSLARIGVDAATELGRQRDLDAVTRRQRRPGTLAYFARMLEDEAAGGRGPQPRDVRVGRLEPAPAEAFQVGEYDLTKVPGPGGTA